MSFQILMSVLSLIFFGLLARFVLSKLLNNKQNSSSISNKSIKENNLQDLVYLSLNAKINAARNLATENPEAIFVAWFQDTAKAFQTQLGEARKVYLASDTTASIVAGKTVILLERYPIHKKEVVFIEHLSPSKLIHLSSLDDALLKFAGGERIKSLMEKMGGAPEEVISHPMISKSIIRAQESIEKKMLSDPEVSSGEEWFAFNRMEKI